MRYRCAETPATTGGDRSRRGRGSTMKTVRRRNDRPSASFLSVDRLYPVSTDPVLCGISIRRRTETEEASEVFDSTSPASVWRWWRRGFLTCSLYLPLGTLADVIYAPLPSHFKPAVGSSVVSKSAFPPQPAVQTEAKPVPQQSPLPEDDDDDSLSGTTAFFIWFLKRDA